MKVKTFLGDYITYIVFYLLTIVVLTLVVIADPRVRISAGNILYFGGLGIFLLIVFLTYEYFRKKRQAEILRDVINKQQEYITELLPEPIDNEQRLYFKLIRKLNDNYRSKLNQYIQGKKDFADFINYWIHEVKTPITASKLLLENRSKSKEEILSSFEDQIMFIENYVEQALYYSRMDSFSQDYFINEVKISGFIKQLVKKSAKLFIEKKIQVELEDLDFTVHSDEKWLAFITEQILINALKYTNRGGKIKIYGIICDKEKCIVIEDNGVGIKPEDIERVFDKGFTGYNGRENLKATGIGLYLAKKLSNKLGHDLTIESVYLEYTRVSIHFLKSVNYLNGI